MHILIVATSKLVLEVHLLLVGECTWKHARLPLPNNSDSTLDLGLVIIHHCLLVESFLHSHANLGVIATSLRVIRLESKS